MKQVSFFLSIIAFFVCAAQFTFAQDSTKTLLFIGSYTGGEPGEGLYVYNFNEESDELTKLSSIEKITNPSFITISPNGHDLYACTDSKLPREGKVAAFAIDSIRGKLSMINTKPCGGQNPVYVSVDPNNRFLAVANYDEGNIQISRLNKKGKIKDVKVTSSFYTKGNNNPRQESSHPHSAVFSPTGDRLFIPDLGSDHIHLYIFDANLSDPVVIGNNYGFPSFPGSGPRHLTFHPNGKFAYCIEELSGTISAYSYSDMQLDSIQRVFSYSKTQESYGSADIHISPDGLFLYGSNRKTENTLSIFAIDTITGLLTLVGHQDTFGIHPRNFTIAPSGKFLLVANQESGNVVVFKRDLLTGLLTKTEHEILVNSPSCLQMRAYGTNK